MWQISNLWLTCESGTNEAHLLDQVSKEDGLLSQRIVNQALGKEDHPMGKIVLRKPRYHTLFLHIRATCDIDDQISQILPVSVRNTQHQEK